MKRIVILAALIAAVGCSMKEDVVGTKDTDDKIIVDDIDNDGDVDNNDTLAWQDSTGIIIDTSNGDQGVVISAIRTERINFDTDGKSVASIEGIDTIAANDLRDEIKNENMSLDLFSITSLKINGVPEFDEFAKLHSSEKITLTIATLIPGESPTTAITTPLSVGKEITLGELQAGLQLNKGLRVVDSTSLGQFESKLKNSTVNEIVFVVDLKFVSSELSVPEDYQLEFTIEGSSKKAI